MLARRDVHCIIRNAGQGWCILSDHDHQPIGITGLTQFSDRLEIYFDFTASKIHSFAVVPDETFAVTDQHTAGASVGMSKAVIWIGKPGINGKLNPANVVNSGGNFFVAGFFSVECD